LIEKIAADCGSGLEHGRRLADLTSLGVGGEIMHLLKPESTGALSLLMEQLSAAKIPYRILGGGANVAGGPGPFLEPVILTRTLKQGLEISGTTVRVGAGFNIKKLVTACVSKGLAGLEWAEGIPGTVGGAVVMNAGAYGGEFSQTIVEASWLEPDGGKARQTLTAGDFSYRKSPLRDRGIVVEGVFSLQQEDPRDLAKTMKEYQARRISSQPPGERSAGCIFRNPESRSAGKLIDEAGQKGTAVGGASVSEVHGNFFVNRGDASSEDLFRLIDLIKKNVLRNSGIELHEEVVLWR
jgi:UDP-N-acetylmuramate dehydrogenase